VFDSFFDSAFGDFMKNDSLCLCGIELENLTQMPGDSLSFAVFIGSQPDGFSFFDGFFQFCDRLFFVGVDFVGGGKTLISH
jgi:hypothetical protein